MDDFNFYSKLAEYTIVFTLLAFANVMIYRHFMQRIKNLESKIEKLEAQKEAKTEAIIKINAEYYTLLERMTNLSEQLMAEFDNVGIGLKTEIKALAREVKDFIKLTLLEHKQTNAKK